MSTPYDPPPPPPPPPFPPPAAGAGPAAAETSASDPPMIAAAATSVASSAAARSAPASPAATAASVASGAPGDPDLLDRPATPARVRLAADAAGASGSARRLAYALAAASPAPADWTRFLGQALLLIGAALALAGIICFFAFNWQDLGRFAKLGLLQVAIVLCAGVGWWRLPDADAGASADAGRSSVIAPVALTAAAVLVGPLLGVFGQTYQTGADPWGLFAAWALLILPWVVVARFTPLWMIAIALIDLALTLFWIQVLAPPGGTWLFVFLLLAAMHAVAVAAWEWQRRRPRPWLEALWAPRLLVAAAFGFLLTPSTALIFDLARRGSASALGFGALLAAVAIVFLVYRRLREDLFMLTVAGGSVLIVLTMAVGRLLFEVMDLELGGLLTMAIFIIVEVALAVAWLRRSVRSAAE